MRLSLTFHTTIGGTELANFSHNGQGITCTTGEHGFESLTLNVPLSLNESFYYYDRLGNAWCVLSNGARNIWEGQVEKVGVVSGGIQIEALGVWRCLSRAKYTSLWSTTDLSSFKILTAEDRSSTTPKPFVMTVRNALTIGLRKGEAYSTSTIGRIGYQIPDGSNRQIVGITFDLEVKTSANYDALVVRTTDGFSGSGSTLFTKTGTGSSITYNNLFNVTAADTIWFELKANTPTTYTGVTGADYIKVTNVRLVTSIEGLINVTLTANITGTGSQTATVGSTAGMYVDQNLVINSGAGASSERVTITAVNSSTQFTAVFATTHSSGETVRAYLIKPSYIIKDLISAVSALDGNYLSSSTALVEDSGFDLTNALYEDANPQDIATLLAGLGDDDGNVWEVGVLDDQMLYFRERASVGRHWYVDPIDPTVLFDMGALFNSVYALYPDANRRTLRTTATTSATSQARYGAEIQEAVRTDNRADTSSSVVAGAFATVALTDGATPAPQVSLGVDRIFDASGGQYANYEPRTGDVVTMRSLSPTISTDIDRIRTFRLSGHSYTVDNDGLELIPERPIPTLDRLVAGRRQNIRRRAERLID